MALLSTYRKLLLISFEGLKSWFTSIDIVFTVGEQTVFTDSNIIGKTHHKHFQSKGILIKTLKKIVRRNDKILFKGSRSMEMDKIIEKVFNI